MDYRQINKSYAESIVEISRSELGWEKTRRSLAELLEHYPGAVAMDGYGVCGFTYSSPLSSDILRISNICVQGDFRGRGIGKRLLQELERQAGEVGYEAVLFSEDSNWFDERSKHWLRSQGYSSIYNADHSQLLLKELL